MSNENFFLMLVEKEMIELCNNKPKIENSLRIYTFSYHNAYDVAIYGTFKFNQIGGFVEFIEEGRYDD